MLAGGGSSASAKKTGGQPRTESKPCAERFYGMWRRVTIPAEIGTWLELDTSARVPTTPGPASRYLRGSSYLRPMARLMPIVPSLFLQ
jgi:hypothetical protein